MRSLPHPDALRADLATAYAVPFTSCTLLRSLVNDVYELTAPAGRYILKLYRADGWTVDEIRWETGLSAHLTDHGLAVPRTRPLADGTDVGVLAAPEGDRPYVLTEYVAGTKPELTDELYGAFGELVARFHRATDDLGTETRRRPERPLGELLPFVSAADADLLQDLSASAHDWLSTARPSRGVCHGDVSLDNLLVTGNGLLLYDFDLAGDGYLAADLTGVAATAHWDAFRTGYTAVRPLTDVDVEAVAWLTVLGRIFNLHFHLVDKPRFRGTESRAEGWAAGELAALRALR